METTIAILVILCAAAIFGFANFKVRQPYEPGPEFRVPYTAIQFVSVLALVFAVLFLFIRA